MNDRPSTLTRRAFLQRGVAGGLAVGAGAFLAACSSNEATPTATGARGGTLRAAVAGGPGTESLDPHFAQYNAANQARIFNLYDSLVRYGTDARPQLQLVEELTPMTSATAWTLRLRQDATFHDGRPVTADDAIYSIRRAADKRSILAPAYAFLDLRAIKKVDARTLSIPTLRPVAILPDLLADTSPVVPRDFDPKMPVGSGPFSLKAFQVDRESQFARYPNYWNGSAQVDELTIASIVDPAARVNALKAGQVDLVDAIPPAQARTLSGTTKLLISEGPGWAGFVMNCRVGPFRDERVRRALRLIVDRPRMVQQVLAGYGRVANDIYSPADPAGIDPSIPQWEHDIDQAKSLLRAAGQPDLTVELTTAPIATGAIEMCTVLAEQATAAGVTIKVRQLDLNAFYQAVNSYPFAVTAAYEQGSSFLQLSLGRTMKTSMYNQAQFLDAEFEKLVFQAVAELDDGKRADLIHQAQRIFHDRGGYVIWGFSHFLDGGNTKLGGFIPSPVSQLGGYNFRSVSVTT